MRLLRVLRIFKMGRYSLGVTLFTGAIWLSMGTLTVLIVCGFIATIIFAGVPFFH